MTVYDLLQIAKQAHETAEAIRALDSRATRVPSELRELSFHLNQFLAKRLTFEWEENI